MTSFAIAVLIVLILLAIGYLLIALYSFGVNLPKRLKLTIGILFIIFVFNGFVGTAIMHYYSIGGIIFYAITLMLGIYILINRNLPKWLKITMGIIAAILVIITIGSCFLVPELFDGMTANSFVDAYSTL